jgi:hypothetical protein
MYCPNCGTTISTEQKFCRSCGLGLEKIAQSLVEQIPTRLEESLQERKDRIERWGVAALSVFGLGIISVALYHIVKMMIEGRFLEGLGYIALMIVLGCGLLSAILFAKAQEVGKVKTKARLSPSEEPTNTTAKLLPPEAVEFTSSVTEGTTELLYAEKKNSKKAN